MADNGVVKSVESDDPTTLSNPAAGTYWWGVDATGFWIKDSAGTVSRPDVGTGINWSEDFTTIVASGAGTVGAWTTVNLGAGFEDALVEILILTNTANNTVGVREVGSANVRSATIDDDSTVTMSIRADASGDIEYFQSDNLAEFIIQARWQ